MKYAISSTQPTDFVAEDEAPVAARPERRSVVSEREILNSLGEVIYEWSIVDDALYWGGNATDVLLIKDIGEIASGRKYAALLDPENMSSPYDAVVYSSEKDTGGGVAYQLQYRLLPKGRGNSPQLWIEDTGRWFAGADGRPVKAHGAIRIINERYEQEQRLAFLSRYDELTGQFNRARFVEILNETMENAKRFNTSSGLMIAAIDNLSVINDCYGYEIADEVIAVAARRLKSRLRGGDAIGRYSGNKFGIMLYNCGDDDITVAARRLIEAMRSEVVNTAAGPVAASVTIGGVIIPRYAQSPAEATARALDSLDQAKRQRRGSYVVFRPSKAREEERRRNIEVSREVVSGLKKQLFRFAYQPIVDAVSGTVKYHECLLRLDRSDGTTAPAESFIPLIEKLGLNRMIDQRAMELALADLAESPEAKLSVNLTSATASNPDWLSYLAAQLRPNSGVAERLTVEITETMALHDIDAARHFIETLKDLGCRVAIDDFGAGYTSFRNLKLFDIDMVKIDGSFIKRLHESPEDQVFVRTLIELAKTFDIETVAEWVGDERTVDILRGWGIDLLQGHYCGAAHMQKPWQATASE